MRITALLPMKGHSERVPNKNMRLFAGRPLYHRVASILQTSSRIDAIVIDTDSHQIAENAKQHFSKVIIVNRPLEISGDMVSINKIIQHDLDFTQGEHFLQTHSTNPLLSLDTLERAIEEYYTGMDTYDSLFSVTRLQTRLYWGSGKAINHNSLELLRTQDLPPVYEENSNIYLFSKQSFQQAQNNRIGLRPKMFTMDASEAIDIDEESDFQIAELLYLNRKDSD